MFASVQYVLLSVKSSFFKKISGKKTVSGNLRQHNVRRKGELGSHQDRSQLPYFPFQMLAVGHVIHGRIIAEGEIIFYQRDAAAAFHGGMTFLSCYIPILSFRQVFPPGEITWGMTVEHK